MHVTRLLGVVALAAGVFLAACSSDSTTAGTASGDGGGGGGDGGGGGGNADASSTPIGQDSTGDGTYYDATGAGACSFDATPNDLDVAAMNAPQFANSAVCGECVAITGPKGSATVRIVDLCPECKTGDLDLSQEAFAKLADVSAGRVKITWHVVPCAVTGNVAYRYKDGSSQYWTAIQVLNSRLPIAKLEWQNKGTWEDVQRESYNYFVIGSGAGTGTVTVRITAIDGQTLTDTLSAVVASTTVQGAAQFN